jgi:antitoxin HicB
VATEHAIKAVVAWHLRTRMDEQHITKASLAKKLHTSRSQIERVLATPIMLT